MLYVTMYLLHVGLCFSPYKGSGFAIPVRLVNGTTESQGRVEIFYQNRQVCHELGKCLS